jgi:DNA-binding transcriptional LysR family regulator
MDKFEDLQAFVAVVEAGSFTAAAERLDANKSVLSRRMSALEERLGVQLLRRTTRTLNLTDTGRSFYERSARILCDLDEAESAVAQQHGELRGQIRVALPLSFGIHHMGEPIAGFNRLHPRIRFDLDLSDRRVDLIQEGIDVGIRIGELRDSSMIARRLFESRTVICASPAYLRDNGVPEHPASLRDHRCLIYSNLDDADRWTWRNENDEIESVRLNCVLAANSGDMLRKVASGGLGVVMLPMFIAYAAIRRGELTPILANYRWPAATAFAIYPPARHLSYRVRAFIDYLVEYFDGTPYWNHDCCETR